MDKIKIILADDHNLIRQSIAKALQEDQRIEVIGQAENGQELVLMLESKKPDLIILDIRMPIMDGHEVLQYLRIHRPDIRVIVLSMFFDNLVIKDLISNGARGFLPKNADLETMLNAIFEVMNTGYFFSKKVNGGLVQELLDKKMINPTFENVNLNENELKLLELICKDKMTKEISSILGVSERTVERYKTGLYEKTRAKTGAGLVLYALKNKLFGTVS